MAALKYPRLRAVSLRVAQSVPVVIGVVIISFMLTRALPGDPAVYFAGAAADEASIQEIRVSLGLDKPLLQQFFIYVGDLLQGDLGQSISSGQPVGQDLANRLPASLELTLTALILSCGIAIPLGVLAATRRGSWVDHMCRVLVTAGVSLPTFFTGIDSPYEPPENPEIHLRTVGADPELLAVQLQTFLEQQRQAPDDHA